MNTKSKILTSLGVGAALVWPLTSQALVCPSGYTQKIVSGKQYCIKVGTGSVLADILTDHDPGSATLVINPLGTCPDESCRSNRHEYGHNNHLDPVADAYILCKNPGKKGKIPPGINAVPIPGCVVSSFTNPIASNTIVIPMDDPLYFQGFRYQILVSAIPSAQFSELKRYCPGGGKGNWTVTDFVPGNFTGSISFGTDLTTIELNDCTANISDVTFDPITGKFNYVPYEGGCSVPDADEPPLPDR